MLVIGWKEDEKTQITCPNGDIITLTHKGRKLGITAPKEYRVLRNDLIGKEDDERKS